MARNGSGSYTNPYPNFVAGTVISSDQVDANNSDIATALTQSIAVDGQSTLTGNIPFNNKKITGLAVGSAATDSANLGQIQANAYAYCGTMGGSADAGTLSPTPAITAYAVGQKFFWKASTNANTGAMTVAISGLSTIAMQNDRAALAAGDHSASDIFMGILDTTSTMQIMRIANPAVQAVQPLDGTPSADHTATGPTTATFNSGYSATIMDLVYMGSGGKWLEADADAAGTSINMLAISLEAKTDGQAMSVALSGSFVRDDTFNFTPGVPVYISNTLGAITATKPTGSGDIVRTVGFAVTADVIFFNPSSDYVILA